MSIGSGHAPAGAIRVRAAAVCASAARSRGLAARARATRESATLARSCASEGAGPMRNGMISAPRTAARAVFRHMLPQSCVEVALLRVGARVTRRRTDVVRRRTLSELSAGECYALGGGNSGNRLMDRRWSARKAGASCSSGAKGESVAASTTMALGAQDAMDSHPPSDHGNEQSDEESEKSPEL